MRSQIRQREASRRHYEANKAAMKSRAVANNAIARRATRAEVAAYKAAHGCVDCGEKDPVVLDFDHKTGEPKAFNVSDAIGKCLGKTRIFAEIAKCDVRCANCHRRMEHLRRARVSVPAQ